MNTQKKLEWGFGANFYPSTAINQLEMWQADSFDLPTIERELTWAASIGMRYMRVFLHDLLWEQDAQGFLARIEQYLDCADKLGIKTSFVFFDDCWNDNPALGKQPAPRPFTHNSGWMQSPGWRVVRDATQWARLEKYVRGVLQHFGKDERIYLWDLYNEPGNGLHGDHLSGEGLSGASSLPLLEAVFSWARDAAPSQPLTVGVWKFDEHFEKINEFSLRSSDVVSFHGYGNPSHTEDLILRMMKEAAGRSLLCSEYMARTAGSTFQGCLPILKKHGVIAINWGLVSGKSQTIYPWNWDASKGNPDKWFHDVFDKNGSLLYEDERAVFEQVR